MEAFESFVVIALETEGFVVSPAVKFAVQLQTRKTAYAEMQTHGYEVDLVGARADALVLATVKSFLGSRGVVAEHVTGETTNERFQGIGPAGAHRGRHQAAIRVEKEIEPWT
jgi:hypothetical protein